MDYIEEMQEIRQKNIMILKTKYEDYYEIINDLFDISYRICNCFSMEDKYLRLLGMTYTKGLLVSKSIYSLILDGHGQESGALLRYLLEVIELLVYIRDDETRIEELVEDRLPTAGKRAQIIDGKFQSLRKYLNVDASHFNLSYYSFSHIVDFKDYKLLPNQTVGEKVLMRNLNTFCTFLYFLCYEITIAICGKTKVPLDLIKQIDDINIRTNRLSREI